MKKFTGYMISLAVCTAGGFAVLLMRDFFHLTDSVEIQNALVDAFFVPGIIMLCFGGLLFASANGAFDMLAFGMTQFFSLFRSGKYKKKYKDFYEYSKSKEERKFVFGSTLVIGVLFIAVSLVLQFSFGF